MKELPHFWQWKMLRKGAYTVALEPANCRPEQRSKARKRGELKFLKPGEVVRTMLRSESARQMKKSEDSSGTFPGRAPSTVLNGIQSRQSKGDQGLTASSAEMR
jgi:hypothetical protein